MLSNYQNFLKNLIEQQNNKVILVKITLLNLYKEPLDEIQGQIISGNINIDGASAIRRTCSLTLLASSKELSDAYWALKTRFKLEIGVKNDIDENYPKEIWFNQGYFIITSFSTSETQDGKITISINGKDLMCLLNGEFGGVFNSIIDFGTIDNNGIIEKIPVKEIIREMVHQYAQEPFDNIIIKDLDKKGRLLQEYRENNPLYIWRKEPNPGQNDSITPYENGTIFGDRLEGKVNNSNFIPLQMAKEEDFESLYAPIENDKPIPKWNFNGTSTNYYVTKIQYGDIAGYSLTEITYPGELVARPGETITSVLDKIKNMLSLYEYFYDIDGHFIFQRKKDTYKEDTSYIFSNKIMTTLTNHPLIDKIKNDVTVWEKTRTTAGAEIPIAYRIAIDKKPFCYKTLDGAIYVYEEAAKDKTKIEEEVKAYLSLSSIDKGLLRKVDWRELIYQMMKDYRKYNHDEDFSIKLREANPILCRYGITGYEQYYIDIEKFWRQLYDLQEKTGEYNWNEKYLRTSLTNFFLDFDDSPRYEPYSTKVIGIKPKVINENIITTTKKPNIPQILFVENILDSTPDEKKLSKFQYHNFKDSFNVSSQQKSAEEKAKEVLYDTSNLVSSISFSTIPVYGLEPNSLIYVYEPRMNINDFYLVTKISFSLTYNSLMNFQAIRVQDLAEKNKQEQIWVTEKPMGWNQQVENSSGIYWISE